MAGFYNPYSAKPDYAGGIQQTLMEVLQALLVRNYGKGGQGQQQAQPQLGTTPTAQPRPTTSMGQSQQAMRQRMPQTMMQTQGMGMPTGGPRLPVGGPQQQQMVDVTDPKSMDSILGALPPALRQMLLAYIQQSSPIKRQQMGG